MPVKKVIIDRANRLYQMPPDLFESTLTEKKVTLLKRKELINLASFDWPCEWENDTSIALEESRPASDLQLTTLKEEIAAWMMKVHRVKINPNKDIFIGSSISSLVHDLALGFIDNGDVAFVPSLGVPLYRQAIVASGGESIRYDLLTHNQWQPSFDRISGRLGHAADLVFINSPHNPTGAILGENELSDLVSIASKENIMIVNDAAYQGIDDRTPPSLLSVKGGKKVGIELYSFSYLLGLPSLPYGFAVGQPEIIRGLRKAASMRSLYIPSFFVEQAIANLRSFPGQKLLSLRSNLRSTLAEADKMLTAISNENNGLASVPYVWSRIERRRNSVPFARSLYRKYRILAIPGTAFGPDGQGFMRFSLTSNEELFRKAKERIEKKVDLSAGVEDIDA